MSENQPPESSVTDTSQEDDLSILNQLTEGEDEFDVDLMACGCRLEVGAKLKLGVDDIVRLFDLNDEQKTMLIGALIDEAKISPDRVFEIVDKVSKGKISEPSLKASSRPTLSKK